MVKEIKSQEEEILSYQFKHKEPPPDVTNPRFKAMIEA